MKRCPRIADAFTPVRGPAFLSNAPLDVWLNASAPFAEDGITFDRCRILDRDYSSIDALQRPEDVGSLGTIECTEWEYDESLFMVNLPDFVQTTSHSTRTSTNCIVCIPASGVTTVEHRNKKVRPGLLPQFVSQSGSDHLLHRDVLRGRHLWVPR